MIIHSPDPSDGRLELYGAVSEPLLARDAGIFVAEGRLVVERVLADCPLSVRSLLLNEASLHALRLPLCQLPSSTPVFVLPSTQFADVTGYNIHRGCLAIVDRPADRRLADVISGAHRIVALEAVTNADNVGGVFRNAAAFGVDAVLLGPGSCDPLYRKAIRTSMAATLRVPFCRSADLIGDLVALRASGFAIVALTPQQPSTTLEQFVSAPLPARVVFLVGTEGQGLRSETLQRADVRIRIPIRDTVDSLNLAVATGIVLARLSGTATL